MARARRRLTHLDDAGRARMVDVSAKPVTVREAVARGEVTMQPRTLARVAAGTLPKGYDMCKAVDRGMTLGQVRLVRKSGGQSGTFVRPGER